MIKNKELFDFKPKQLTFEKQIEKYTDFRFPFPPHILRERTKREKYYKHCLKWHEKLNKLHYWISDVNQLTLKSVIGRVVNYMRWVKLNFTKIRRLISTLEEKAITNVLIFVENLGAYVKLHFKSETLLNMRVIQNYAKQLVKLLKFLKKCISYTILIIQGDKRNNFFIHPALYHRASFLLARAYFKSLRKNKIKK